MRNMSFALTKDQIRNRTKRVTRRNGWEFAKAGDEVQPVEKCQGLKKGEHVTRLIDVPIMFENVRREPLEAILDEGPEATALEGFPEMSAEEFIQFYCKHNKCTRDETITRIEFDYMPF